MTIHLLLFFHKQISDVEVIGDSAESGGVLLHIVHFCNLRGGVSEKVGNLSRCECLDRAIWQPDAVHQICGECVP